MSALGLQKRLYGGANRINWRTEDMSRIAKRFDHTGAIPPPLKRDASALVDLSAAIERSAEPLVYLFTISTTAIDLMSDTISVNGWDLSGFRANPVVQFSHNGDMLPIGKAVSTFIENGRLKSRMVFSSDGFATRVKRQVDESVIRGASVGFLPGKWDFSKDPKCSIGIDFIEGHRLLEWSICNVPCNPQCLFQTVGGASDVSRSAQLDELSTTTYAEAARHADAATRRLSEIRARVLR